MTFEWKKGLQALAGDHSRVVANKASARRSSNIDAQFGESHPNDSRWDYIVERPVRSSARTGAGIGVHPARSGQDVASLIAKMGWAKTMVAEHEPDLRVDRWHWVPTGTVGFKATDRYGKVLASAGVGMPRRTIDQL